jgi:steroid delta-isomerase-like uncharacterized protein
MADTKQNKEIVKRYRDIHNTDHLDQLDQIVARDLISHNLMPGLPQGLESGKKVHLSVVASFPDNRTVTDDLIAEGDYVVERWTNTGTFSGAPFMGAPATGKKFKVSGVSIYRIQNGKIVEHWGEFNQMAVLQQIGIMQVPQQGQQGQARY